MIGFIQKLHKRINIMRPFIQNFVRLFVWLETYGATWTIYFSEDDFRSDQIGQELFSVLEEKWNSWIRNIWEN
jgi:hypothetical protein